MDNVTPQNSFPPPNPSATENILALGRTLYHIRGCVQCHGDKGKGDGRRVFKKKMKVKPQIFKKGLIYKNGLTKEGIKKTLIDGVETDGVYYMPRYWYLKQEDIEALAEYVLFLSDSQE